MAESLEADVSGVCFVVIEMLKKKKENFPLWLPTFEPAVRSGIRENSDYRPL